MIPVSKPHLTFEDAEAVKTCIMTGWISQGARVREFEKAWAAYIGVKHCVMTSSGTTALQLALSALGIGAGHEVIIPDLTFAAVANAVISVGAKPVCVDVDRETWNLLPKKYAKASARVVVHSYGNPCAWIKDMLTDTPLIEDCAEAHGATINGRKVGSFGLMSTFSFYANKIITTGEGGCVCTNDEDLNIKLRLLRDHGMDPEVKYLHHVPGFNYRITDMQAALGLSQLKRIQQELDAREGIAHLYSRKLKSLGFVDSIAPGSVNWLYTALCPEYISRDDLASYLKDHGVETRPMFRPISSFGYINQPRCENAAALSVRGISLPTYNGLAVEAQNEVIRLIKQYVNAPTIH